MFEIIFLPLSKLIHLLLFPFNLNSPTKLKVFNFSTGPFHPEWTFGRFFGAARELAIAYPSSKQLRPLLEPPRIKKASIFFPVEKFIYHTLFAFLIDLILSLLGYKKM